MHRVTKTAWFGSKKNLGWGWSPKAWQGWAVTGAFVVLVVVCLTLFGNSARFISVGVLIVALLLVTFLTGDPPGGPSSKARS